MSHGNIALWHKKPGDLLVPGDLLCDVETDKASVGFEFQDEGVLAKILIDAKAGQEIKVGQPIAFIVSDEKDYQEFLKLPPSAYPPITSDPVAAPTPSSPPQSAPIPQVTATPTPSAGKPHPNATLSPAARHIIDSKSIDPSTITGTSKGGRIITKADVINAINSGKVISKPVTQIQTQVPATPVVSQPVASQVTSSNVSTPQIEIGGTYTDVPNSNMRKVIAKRLTESKLTVPHMYSSIECDITELLNLRNKFKKEANVTVSVNDLVIKASALALKDVPECNGFWNPTTGKPELNSSIDISVAVATPNGLITPIVKNVDALGLSSISNNVKDLATRARDGKLKPQEYQGGTFTISNLGMFGISSFSAVINPPQACILAVGGGIQRVIPNPSKPDDVKITTTMIVQLSADRRVVDEAIAAQFLQVFQTYLSNPSLILL
eukprot:CAMPEP_0174820874 /NCGR_PEP_ID=MMETSP1107-20130205/4979_1 /TAXON_ID=36770 /ORGANISM="Paraphysomonas vestita, Strain GFlagA" /LENGTH=437 /DNA_ID=CAMNT_0016037055 /DNA_START=164 /DNA_END=1477 /DNA_ORIENTATION=+